MQDKDFELDDVKEYTPRKRNRGHFMDNYNVSPSGSGLLMSGGRLGYEANDLDNGIMLSTSEVIDFSEGTDSWTNRH
jgi:hypothetical protein